MVQSIHPSHAHIYHLEQHLWYVSPHQLEFSNSYYSLIYSLACLIRLDRVFKRSHKNSEVCVAFSCRLPFPSPLSWLHPPFLPSSLSTTYYFHGWTISISDWWCWGLWKGYSCRCTGPGMVGCMCCCVQVTVNLSWCHSCCRITHKNLLSSPS